MHWLYLQYIQEHFQLFKSIFYPKNSECIILVSPVTRNNSSYNYANKRNSAQNKFINIISYLSRDRKAYKIACRQ